MKTKSALLTVNIMQVLMILVLYWAVQGYGRLSNKSADGFTAALPESQQIAENTAALLTAQFIASSELTLSADGPELGESAYSLIAQAFGDNAIEAPDFFVGDHVSQAHIIEAYDNIVGPHFVFLAHRDQDHNKGLESDRQRNEIKIYDKSALNLKAYRNDTMQYSWKFKVSSELELSKKFSHFFQLKARNFSNDNTNGNDEQPLVTLSGVEKGANNELQVRFSRGSNVDGNRSHDVYLAALDWDLISDEWLHIFVQATFAEQGVLKFIIKRMSDNQVLLELNEANLDMWRGFDEQDFVRPKWGIYRSTLDTDSLRADEEQVRFADFSIKKGKLAK